MKENKMKTVSQVYALLQVEICTRGLLVDATQLRMSAQTHFNPMEHAVNGSKFKRMSAQTRFNPMEHAVNGSKFKLSSTTSLYKLGRREATVHGHGLRQSGESQVGQCQSPLSSSSDFRSRHLETRPFQRRAERFCFRPWQHLTLR